MAHKETSGLCPADFRQAEELTEAAGGNVADLCYRWCLVDQCFKAYEQPDLGTLRATLDHDTGEWS